jgi:GNAT superfamily N-acetyltransferase
MPSLKQVDLRTFSASFINFPHDRGFLAGALTEPDAAIYVDDFKSPRVTLLTGNSTPVSFVTGDPAFAHAVADKLLELHHHKTRGFKILSPPDGSWHQTLVSYSKAEHWLIPRVDYQYDSNIQSFPVPTLEHFPLQGDLLDRVHADCDPEFDPDYFRQHNGIGFAATDLDRVVSVAWTPIVDNWTNIAIATAPEYRRRGLATGLGALLIERCRLLDVHLHVTTDQRNSAARAWARRLGFAGELLHDWTVFRSVPGSKSS